MGMTCCGSTAKLCLQLAAAMVLFLLALTRVSAGMTSSQVSTSTSEAIISCKAEAAHSSNQSTASAGNRSVGMIASSRHDWRSSSSLHYPTVKCGIEASQLQCSVQNVYGEWPDRRKCHAARAVFPTNEAELVEAVAGAVRRRQSIKVATATGHSIPQWACARGSKGLIVSTQNLNRRIDVDQGAMRVSVDSGVQVRELVDTLARAGLALPHSPYWDAITVGGLLSTGSHGSSLVGKGAAVHEYVVAMRLVVPAAPQQGYAQVLQLSSAHHPPFLLNAARVSLGLLGVISQVTLEVEPQFKRALKKEVERDDNLEEKVLQFGFAYEFGDLTWLPSMHKVILSKQQRVPYHTSGHENNAFIPFLPTHFLVRSTLRLLEEAAERSRSGKCAIAAFLSSALWKQGPGQVGQKRRAMIGYNHQMQASGRCASSQHPQWACPWARPGFLGFFYHETSFTLPLHNATLLLQDIKTLRAVASPTSVCGLDFYSGILLRYVKQSSAYLGHQSDGISMDITYYRSHHAHVPRLDEDIYEEIEQMALFKYGGWPHWGKNRPLAFAGLRSKYPNMDKFLLAKKIIDPDGLFSNEWSDSVLGIKGNVSSDDDYCALEGMCVCSEDRHCAPERGYFCQPGRIYKEARVCSTRHGTDPYIVKLIHSLLVSWMQTCITCAITIAYDLIVYVQDLFS